MNAVQKWWFQDTYWVVDLYCHLSDYSVLSFFPFIVYYVSL